MILNNKRALAYTTRVVEINPIENADNIELIRVLGWNVVAKKGEFSVGDMCVFFEIDSKLPERDWSLFMKSKNYKVKTMKLGKFNVISQGLALPIRYFSEKIPTTELVDVTDLLGVTYYDSDDEFRKADFDKLKMLDMQNKHKRLFNKPFIKKLMRYKIGRNILYFLFGSRRDDIKYKFPSFVSKTDEERIENQTWRIGDGKDYVMTEKLDGTSCTFAMERIGKSKFKFYVASRNRCLPEDESVYWKLAKQYNIENVLKEYLVSHPTDNWIYIQGEGIGEKIQKNYLKLKGNDLYLFNVITNKSGRFSTYDVKAFAESNGMKCVPIIGITKLPNTMEEIKEMASGSSALNNQVLREGLVCRTLDGRESFKNVSKTFLLKHSA